MIKKISHSVVLTFILLVILVALVSGAGTLLHDKIIESNSNRKIDFISSIIDVEFDNNPVLEKISVISDDNGEVFDIYPVRLNGMVNSVVVKVINNKGFSGRIEMLVSFYMDGTVAGYKVISHDETIGLGSLITEDWFSNQFKFMHPETENIKVKKDGGEIDAITSATISSRAVISSLKMGYNAYRKFLMDN